MSQTRNFMCALRSSVLCCKSARWIKNKRGEIVKDKVDSFPSSFSLRCFRVAFSLWMGSGKKEMADATWDIIIKNWSHMETCMKRFEKLLKVFVLCSFPLACSRCDRHVKKIRQISWTCYSWSNNRKCNSEHYLLLVKIVGFLFAPINIETSWIIHGSNSFSLVSWVLLILLSRFTCIKCIWRL